jgi:hypothetical protein
MWPIFEAAIALHDGVSLADTSAAAAEASVVEQLLAEAMSSVDKTMRYNAFGTPNLRTDTHAIITPTNPKVFPKVFANETDLATIFFTVFSAERDRALQAKARGARLVSALSAPTNGHYASFLYYDINAC